ncbi:SDR family NAD(P)-dependent oxidoreductase [Aquabacterium fontiphilum]|uniref:polysaccharide biosynthesis protein n=1 Tax=Aquabacterium fontiphilum TaxID=450365 RepID=UPI001378CE3F|nr:nucleoside-diphosphate sugar epimerase/dehydratase [Aquabacterium fontiphilum]NBD20527.1 SDR family NAD(P)-dependent oxidoreductase [Aquabacterium fontiphilum]
MLWSRLNRFLDPLRRQRQPSVLLVDALLIFLAWHATYLFRLGFERWLHERPPYDLGVVVGVIAVYSAVSWALGVPRASWRYTSFSDIARLGWVCLGAGLASAVVVLMAQLSAVPRAVLALHPVMALIALSLARMLVRMLSESSRARRSGARGSRQRVVVLGAGAAAKLLIAGIQHRGWEVVGLLDDDVRKHGTTVSGVPVWGGLELLTQTDVLEGVSQLILAMPSATIDQRRRILDLASSTGLPITTVPTADELRQGRSRVDRLRDIGPEDVLGRDPVRLDEQAVSQLVSGQTVLVTGAGGSIGSELCRQIARFGPTRLVLFELSEFALYQIEQELGELFPHLPLVRLVGDVKDAGALDRAMSTHRPDLLFHAAAYKHVPLMEDDNAWLALRNNTWGTYLVAQAAARHGVARVVLISTDKAVNPTNVMGATKRAAEMVLSHWAERAPGTRFTAVRFGNVLGSSGSVIPKFKEQIARGGPVTVTHPDITRYFMTIPEAAQLVLQAAALAETGQVFVMDMGESVRIVDLARKLIHLSGHTEAEIPIVYCGLRPGEKLFEELLANDDTTLPTPHPRLRLARLRETLPAEWLDALLALVHDEEAAVPAVLRARLHALVPEYQPR